MSQIRLSVTGPEYEWTWLAWARKWQLKDTSVTPYIVVSGSTKADALRKCNETRVMRMERER